MEERKIKTKDEWKGLIHDSLTPEQFQDLCYDLIKLNGFSNVKPRGKGGDGGRDLEGGFKYSIAGKEEVTDKCWFQCKRLKVGLNFGEISTELQKAEDQNVRRFFILSITDTTPQCKDDIANWNCKHRCEVVDWSGSKFLDVLFELPTISKTYFPDEEVPPVVNIKNPQLAIELSSALGKRYGINIELKTPKEVNLSNPVEVAEVLKESLLKLKDVDVNIKALLYEKISMFFFALERHEDALMFLNTSLDITPKNLNALLTKGFILEKIDRIDESNACYDQILASDSANKLALNNKAHNLMRVGEFQDALSYIDRTLDADPQLVIAIHNKAEILKGLKKSKEAIEFIDEQKELVSQHISLQLTKVDLCIELLDLKQAYALNEEILKKDPSLIGAINDKGRIYEKNSHFQHKEKYLNLALECFEKVIQTNEKYAYALGGSNKAVVFINSGNIADAEKIITMLYALFPKNPHILNKKGVVLLHSNPKEALKYFQRALSLTFDEDFLLNGANAYLKLGHWKEANETADKLLKYNTEKSDAWGIKGLALKQLHQLTMAKICFEKAEKFLEKPISLLED